MRLGRLFIIVALVLIVGVGALLFLLQSTGDGGEEIPVEEQIDTIEVVIVEQFIPRGDIITEEKLNLTKIPINDTIVTAEGVQVYFTDIAEAAGRRARYDLDQAVLLTKPMTIDPGQILSDTGSDASLDIPPQSVAISIPIDRFSSVAYGLQRGDHVNVIVSMLFVDIDTEFQTILPNATAGVLSPGFAVVSTEVGEESVTTTVTSSELLQSITAQTVSGGLGSPIGRTEFDSSLPDPFYVVPSELQQRPRLVSQTIMQDVIVLHVGNFDLNPEEVPIVVPLAEGDQAQPGDPNAQPQEDPDEAAEEEEIPPDIITLIVSPQDAVTLNYLMLIGADLNLVMRASGDDSRVFTQPVTLDWLLAQHNIPLPTRLPYGFEPAIYRIISPGAFDIIDLILSAGDEN